MRPVSWTTPPSLAHLRPPKAYEVQCWQVDLSPAAGLGCLLDILDDAETERLSRLGSADLRERWRNARTALRHLLGAYLRIDPRAVPLRIAAKGKPFVADSDGKPSDLEFNLSHSGDIMILGVTSGRPLGIDLEAIRPVPEADRIVDSHFSALERQSYYLLELDQREQGFFNAWTRKEAYIKATGLGLSQALDAFSVSLSPNDAPALLDVAGNADEAGLWTLRDLAVPAGYASALAVRGAIDKIDAWHWTESTG
jgi:4'-phosphopantetheinyl transferase